MNENEDFRAVVAQLKGLYEAELQVAERTPVKVSQAPIGRSRASLSIAGLAVAALAVAGIAFFGDRLLPLPGGSTATPPNAVGHQPGSAGPTATPVNSDPTPATGSAEPIDEPIGDLVDGIPSSLDGTRVFLGRAALERAANGDDASFLVGGWAMMLTVDCLDPCEGSGVSLKLAPPGERGDMVGLRSAAGSVNVPIGRPIILRVHRDVASGMCDDLDDCAASVVVDEVVWSGEPLE